MRGHSDATSHEEYIDRLDEPRRSEIRRLHELILRAAPELEPTMALGMLGYGPFHYRYASGREGDTAVLAVASNQRYISLYVTGEAPGGGYLAESFKDRLPKASIGKGCVRFKRLGDLDQAQLERLLREAAAQAPRSGS